MSFEVDENIIMYAFRYALGRKTYSVSEVSEVLIDNWHRFKPHIKEQIIREIETAIERNEAGMECDINAWKSVLLLEEAVKDAQLAQGEQNGSSSRGSKSQEVRK